MGVSGLNGFSFKAQSLCLGVFLETLVGCSVYPLDMVTCCKISLFDGG